ncbi:MAG: SpoIIE family protein phosphatase [Bacteroidales bacterium]|nr:SpoIIE family protein phosphatase [Bacteroidales bacterium]
MLCSFFTATAQVVSVDLFNADNGLPQTHVNAIIQDSTGFLWIGTQDGLCRYDGYQFVTYTNNPLDSLSICNNYIYSIADDGKGNLWVGTRYGLSRLDKTTGEFKNYYANNQDHNSLAGNRAYAVFCDSQGAVWVKTKEALHLYNAASDNFVQYLHYNDIFTHPSESRGYSIIEDSQSRIWLGSEDGLFLFNRQLGIFKRYSYSPDNPMSISSNQVTAIFEDSYGNFWVGTDKGLNRFDSRTGVFYRIPEIAVLGSSIGFIGQDTDGLLWIGAENGFGKYSFSNGVSPVNNLMWNNQVVKPVNVSSILRDRSSVIWVGSRLGLLKWNPFGARFESFGKDLRGRNLFSNNIITSLLEQSGTVWLGTWGAGVYVFDPQTCVNEHYTVGMPGCELADDFVRTLFRDRQGRILVGTRSGLFMYQPVKNRFVDYFDYRGIYVGDIFVNNCINAIDEDDRGNLWIATESGLHIARSRTLNSYYSRRRDSLSLSGNDIRDVLVDSKGFVWAATNNGLNWISPKLDSIRVFQRAAKYSGVELISNEILCLHEDRNGFIWVGTTAGLHRYNRQSNTFKLYTDQQNLPNKVINSIEEDTAGRLWISTNKGLVVLNPINDMVRAYTTSDGLLSNEFNMGASHKSTSGKLYFGSMLGYNSFNPDSISINENVPNVAFTRIEVIGLRGTRNLYSNGSEGIVVGRDFKTITVEFAALDYSYPEKNMYRYQMIGMDDKWVELGHKHSATFTNLKEGVYYFKVMGANSDQIWCASPTVLKIRVVAPFWRSRIANYVYAFLGLCLLLSYLYYRNKGVQRINNLLQEREFVLLELEKQKEELMLKNKNITDSINYAKRIQDAILPPIDSFKTYLPDSFILFMPKDIVSGDFYWINETKNKTFVAVVDCTGHGVPGAFMSIIGIELLRNITSVEGIDDAAEILNRLSISIHETFTAGVLNAENGVKVKDGMDVAFCVIDREYNILQYSGAYSNLYLLRDGKIIEVKGDRYSVGMASDTGHLLFSSHYIPIQPNDMIYLFTDGYIDQFGGAEGKKFKFRRFRHLLLNIYKLPLDVQRKYLYDGMMEWMGDNEQVDDILIIGIRPDLSCMF